MGGMVSSTYLIGSFRNLVLLTVIKSWENNMAMDLFCYSSLPFDEVRKITDLVAAQQQELFAAKFLISQARKAGAIQREIALDYGVHAKSFFLIHYNDKSATDLSPSVIEIIKTAFGNGEVVILFENESLR